MFPCIYPLTSVTKTKKIPFRHFYFSMSEYCLVINIILHACSAETNYLIHEKAQFFREHEKGNT